MNSDQLANLTNALEKLETITAENRAYLLTPGEAAALLAHVRGLDAFRKGMSGTLNLIAGEHAGGEARP